MTEIQTTLIKGHFAATADYRNGDLTEPLFMAQKGGSINYSNFRNRYFEPALTVAGISKTRIHDLRRTTATILFANQVDLKTIETMMGHSDARMTLGVYASATQQGSKSAADILERVLRSKSKPYR